MEILNLIGHTPIVEIKNPHGDKFGKIYLKLENFNLGGSIKSRVGLAMVEQALKDKRLKKGDTIIEATGGNTGIGLAIASNLYDLNLILCVPDNFSKTKIETLKFYGAKVLLADHTKGNDCHIKLVKNMLKENPKLINLDQFTNNANPQIHYNQTGSEILSAMKNRVDYFISVIGSGGTITGVGKCLKDNIKNVKIIGVKPLGCDILNNIFIPHKIQATAVGIKPPFITSNLIDKMEDITYEETLEARKILAKKGLFVGISSGANFAIALRVSRNLTSDKNIITIVADDGKDYIGDIQ